MATPMRIEYIQQNETTLWMLDILTKWLYRRGWDTDVNLSNAISVMDSSDALQNVSKIANGMTHAILHSCSVK